MLSSTVCSQVLRWMNWILSNFSMVKPKSQINKGNQERQSIQHKHDSEFLTVHQRYQEQMKKQNYFSILKIVIYVFCFFKNHGPQITNIPTKVHSHSLKYWPKAGVI